MFLEIFTNFGKEVIFGLAGLTAGLSVFIFKGHSKDLDEVKQTIKEGFEEMAKQMSSIEKEVAILKEWKRNVESKNN